MTTGIRLDVGRLRRRGWYLWVGILHDGTRMTRLNLRKGFTTSPRVRDALGELRNIGEDSQSPATDGWGGPTAWAGKE
jgi:hypothetical protein